jgi:FMN phosphatase YigB (HAD superfamily)
VTVTNPDLKPALILPAWQDVPRGAKWISNPFDVMIDIDDVIFPTMMAIHELAREKGYHNGDVDPTWTGWQTYNIPEQAYWDLWSDFALANGYLETPPIEEAVEELRRLYFEGHRVHLVTARGFMAHATDIRAWTQTWIEEFAIPWHSLTFARDKVAAQWPLAERFQGGLSSREVFFDYALDDSPRNVKGLRRAGVAAYLLDHVHNKSHIYDQRVATVGEFVDMILEEAK